MSIIIRSINNSKIELLLNKKNITVSINNDYEKFIIYRDLVLYISLLTISSSSKYSYKDNEKYVEKFINSIACLLNKHKFSIGIGYGYSGIGYMLYVLSHITKKYENLLRSSFCFNLCRLLNQKSSQNLAYYSMEIRKIFFN